MKKKSTKKENKKGRPFGAKEKKNPNNLTSLRDRLLIEREEKHLTLKELSERTNIKDKTLSAFETGERKPNIDDLISIAKVLNVPTDYLLGLQNQKSMNIELSETSKKIGISEKSIEIIDELENELKYIFDEIVCSLNFERFLKMFNNYIGFDYDKRVNEREDELECEYAINTSEGKITIFPKDEELLIEKKCMDEVQKMKDYTSFRYKRNKKYYEYWIKKNKEINDELTKIEKINISKIKDDVERQYEEQNRFETIEKLNYSKERILFYRNLIENYETTNEEIELSRIARRKYLETISSKEYQEYIENYPIDEDTKIEIKKIETNVRKGKKNNGKK